MKKFIAFAGFILLALITVFLILNVQYGPLELAKENKSIGSYLKAHPDADGNVIRLSISDFNKERVFWEEGCDKNIEVQEYYKIWFEDSNSKITALFERSKMDLICLIHEEKKPKGSIIIDDTTPINQTEDPDTVRTLIDTNLPDNVDDEETPPEDDCVEQWLCYDWGDCSNGKQTRNCEELVSCGYEGNEPDTEQNCSPAVVNIDEEWKLFQDYLLAMKNHDMDLANTYSYEDYNLDPCIQEYGDENCWAMIDGVYSLSNNLLKSDFKFVERDSKQSIISTEMFSEDGYDYVRQIFFVKNNQNKLLMMKLMYQTTFGVDTDKDGLPDEREKCEGVYAYDSTCKKTSITKKDTDGDGWWDSIEEEAETDPTNPTDYLFK